MSEKIETFLCIKTYHTWDIDRRLKKLVCVKGRTVAAKKTITGEAYTICFTYCGEKNFCFIPKQKFEEHFTNDPAIIVKWRLNERN